MRFFQLEFQWAPRRPKRAPAATRRAGGRADAELTAWCRETVAAMRLPKLAAVVGVRWNPRMRSTAGRAWWPQATIELNPRLRELPEDELWRTVRHELAHLIAYQRAGRRRIQPHGPEWRRACAELGIPDENPCHDLPLPRHRQKRRFAYVCPNCAAVIERVRRMRGMVACYSCCQQFNRGQFDKRFRLREKKLG